MAASVLTEGPIELDAALYPEGCVRSGIESYRQFLVVRRLASSTGKNVIALEIQPSFSQRGDEIRREFLNYLLGLVAKRRLSSQ